MKKLYQTAKETTKKYFLPLVVAGSLVLGSCGDEKPNLPIPDNTKNYRLEKIAQIDSLEKEAKNYLVKGKESLLEGISDGYYNKEEMKGTLSNYKKIDSLYKKINEIKESINLDKEDFSLNEKEENLKSKLEEVLTGFDYGKAEIEKDFESIGYDVKVENLVSISEGIWNIYIPLAFFGLRVSYKFWTM